MGPGCPASDPAEQVADILMKVSWGDLMVLVSRGEKGETVQPTFSPEVPCVESCSLSD